MNEPLFQSAHAALLFAYNFHGSPAMSIMNRMIINPGDTIAPPSKGLAGLDGAAQAGMIRRHVAGLGKFHESLIIAEFAPRVHPCSCRSSCCSGYTRNQEWSDAVNYIADIVRTGALNDHKTTHPIRRACVEKFMGAPITLVMMAKNLSLDEDTVSKMIGKVKKYLIAEQAKARAASDDCLTQFVSHK